MLWVDVRDNGVGLDPEQPKRIFQVFVSGKGNRGTGLGLAVSQKILQEHGGEIPSRASRGRAAASRSNGRPCGSNRPATERLIRG